MNLFAFFAVFAFCGGRAFLRLFCVFFCGFVPAGDCFFAAFALRFERAFCEFCGFAFCGGRAVFHN